MNSVQTALYFEEPYPFSSSISTSSKTSGLEALRDKLRNCFLDSSYEYVDATSTEWWAGSVDSSSTVLHPKPSISKETLTMSTADQAALVVHTLGFSKLQLAKLFGVSRQAIYDWLKGSEISDKNVNKLSELAQLLWEVTVDTRRPLYHRFTTQPLDEGEPSILDLLCTNPWDTDRIRTLLRRARDLTTERQARQDTSRSKRSSVQGDSNLMDNLLSLGGE